MIENKDDTIPISPAAYIDRKWLESTEAIQEIVEAHIRDENLRYEEILAQINAKDEHSEKRHVALLERITAYMEKQPKIETAFLNHEEGKPDFSGHYHYHRRSKDKGDKFDKLRDSVVTKVVEYIGVAIVVWTRSPYDLRIRSISMLIASNSLDPPINRARASFSFCSSADTRSCSALT